MSVLNRTLAVIAAGALVLSSVEAQYGPHNQFWSTPPINEPALSSTSYDASIAVIDGGKEAWITSSRAGGMGGYDIWYSFRANSTQPWGPVTNSALNTAGAEFFMDVSEDGLEGVFSQSPTNGAGDLVLCWRLQTGVDFSTANAYAITAANTAGDDGDPSLSSDNLTCYFQSDTGGSIQNGIYKVTRPTRIIGTNNWTGRVLVGDTSDLDHSAVVSESDNYLGWSRTPSGAVPSNFHFLYRPDAGTAFTGAPVLEPAFQSPQWQANAQYARADSEFWLVSTNSSSTGWGGLGSSDVYQVKRQVPGLVANVDAVSSATGGNVTLRCAEDAANTTVHLYLAALSMIPATALGGIGGELVLSPSPLFVLGSASGAGTDGISSLTLPLPAGLATGARIHFQTLSVNLINQAVNLSIHESVRIN